MEMKKEEMTDKINFLEGEDAFNFYQSSHRVVIERAFGQLVGR
jgi:hypothetical protein